MNKVVAQIVLMLAVLFLFVGCQSSSQINTNTTLRVEVDKEQGILYHKEDLEIAGVELYYRIASPDDLPWRDIRDENPIDGWQFSLHLALYESYDFKAYAYNSEGTGIYKAEKLNVEIQTTDTLIEMGLEQVEEETVDVTSSLFSMIGKEIETVSGDGVSLVTFHLSNPDNLGYRYTVTGIDDTVPEISGDDTDEGNTLTQFTVSVRSGYTYVCTIVTANGEYIYFIFKIESNNVVVYAPPVIKNPDIWINEESGVMRLFFFTEGGSNVSYSYEIIDGCSTIGTPHAISTDHPEGKSYQYAVEIEGYSFVSSHFKIKFTAESDNGAKASKIFNIGQSQTLIPTVFTESEPYVSIIHYKEREYYFVNYAIHSQNGLTASVIEQFAESDKSHVTDRIQSLQTEYPNHHVVSLSLSAEQSIVHEEDCLKAYAEIMPGSYVVQERLDLDGLPTTLYFSPFTILYHHYQSNLTASPQILIGLFDRQLYILQVTKNRVEQSGVINTRNKTDRQVIDEVEQAIGTTSLTYPMKVLFTDEAPGLKTLLEAFPSSMVYTYNGIHSLLHNMADNEDKAQSSFIQ